MESRICILLCYVNYMSKHNTVKSLLEQTTDI